MNIFTMFFLQIMRFQVAMGHLLTSLSHVVFKQRQTHSILLCLLLPSSMMVMSQSIASNSNQPLLASSQVKSKDFKVMSPAVLSKTNMKVVARKDKAGFLLKRNSVEPIIVYRQSIAMLSGYSIKPSVEVYADGRVKVHQPIYMKQAGDYEYTLSETELVELIQSLSEDGLMSFDEVKVKQDVSSHARQAKQLGQLYTVSDATETFVEVRIDNYQMSQTAEVQPQLKRQFVWKNLETDARHFSDVESLQTVSRAIQKLDALKRHKSMKIRP